MAAMNDTRPAADAAPDASAVLWRGRPGWRAAAVRIWRVRIVGLYFAVLLADGGRMAFAGASHPAAAAWTGEVKLAAIAAVALAALLALAWMTSRSTRYTVEARGVVMRFGVALPATLVVPFGAIERVDVRIHRDQTGDVALKLKPGKSVVYPKLWPHARPWRIARAEPMLRCTPEAGVAAALICRSVAATAEARASQAGEPLPVAAAA